MFNIVVTAVLLCLIVPPAFAQKGAVNGEWRHYGGDAGSTRYSPLDQINESNVKNLQIAWRWKSQNFGARPDYNWQATPLMIGGVLYFTAGSRRAAVAVDAANGETLWMYRLDEGERSDKPVRTNNRGLSYWTDGRANERILFVTAGYQLVALNAKTGVPATGFGKNGVVDLWQGLDRPVIKPGVIGLTSPPMIVGDIAVVGAAFLAGTAPPSKENVPGYIRGYDIRTGRLVWTFKTIPRIGEFGNETWLKDSWQYTGNTGAWAPISADPELGYVYVPTEMPTGDYYGGHRPGDNLFADCLVALDAKTGKRVWHYQMVHHDVWDWDNASAPVLLDVNVNGRAIKSVAQITKQGFTFVFDRVTGQPVWPIEERPVPQSDVPGETTAKTQPFPTKPPPFDLQGTRIADLADYTPEIKAEALKIAAQFKLGPIFTPPIVSGSGGLKATLQLPGSQGGANWQGAAADPELGYLFVPSVTAALSNGLGSDASRSDMAFINLRPAYDSPLGVPLFKAPYGRVTAINLNTGEHAWMVPNGDPPEYLKSVPSLKGVDISNFGNPERAPLLVTKTLLFSGDGGGLFGAPRGGGGPMMRMLNKRTGAKIFEMKLPANETGIPMTYMLNGRQYIAVAIGATDFPAEMITLALPPPGR